MLDSTLSRRRLLAGSAMLGASSVVFAACGGAAPADSGSMEEKPAEPEQKEAAPAKEMESVNIVAFLKVPTELETEFLQNMAEPYIAENEGTTHRARISGRRYG